MSDNNTNTQFENLRTKLKGIKLPPKLVFLFIGITSTIWFLIRVIPKPSRAAYPCMKVAAPFMSSLVIYLLGITGSAFFYKRTLQALKTKKYAIALILTPTLVAFISLSLIQTPGNSKASTLPLAEVEASHPDAPIGEAKGINPGRVAWVYNSEVTNENMTNTSGDYWYEDKNADEEKIQDLLDVGLKSLTGENDASSSWDALFKHYNNSKGNGSTGYTSGEKIFIKVNFTNSCCNGTTHRMDATPQAMTALLKSLIEEAGIPQADITIGDPFRGFKDFHINKCHDLYPNVHYIGPNASAPVEQTVATTDEIVKFSDGNETARIAQAFIDAKYFINMPCLKSHNSGGITIAAKNHQGSILHPNDNENNQSAYYMHYALPDKSEGSGKYRHLVDYMGHEQLGGKTLLILVDAIWGGDNWEGNIFKWQMDPFNDDYPSSLILSQDPVAVEAVCYDILLEEYKDHSSDDAYPYMDGVNDYLWQAASEDYWPSGITYDPEGDGTKIGSLGVYEHWNNATTRKYSRNLGSGNGIELIEKNTRAYEYPASMTAENSELPSNQVNTVYVDSSNNVWIGTDAGLSMMSETGWKHYDTILLNLNVNDIAYERTGYGKELWVATDSGLTVSAYNDLDGVTGATTYTTENSDIVGNVVSTVDVDKDHHRWIGTDSAINIFKGSSWYSNLLFKDVENDLFKFVDYAITDIKQYDTLALISTKGKGVARMSFNDVDGFSGASAYGLPWGSIASDEVNSIAVKDEVQAYATTEGASLHTSEYMKNDWTTINEDSQLVSNKASSTYLDKNNNTWIGTNAGISIVLSDGGMYEYTETEGLLNNMINQITNDIFGNIWIATSGGVQWVKGIQGKQIKMGTPVTISPEDFATEVALTDKIVWSEITGASSYKFEIASDQDFTNITESSDNNSSTSYNFKNLGNSTTYYWRVAAKGSSLESDWSESARFTTEDLIISTDKTNFTNNNIRVYPNPASENIFINISAERAQLVTIKIYSTNGKLIDIPMQNLQVSENENTLNLDLGDRSKYPSGLYILKIEGETFSQVSRLSIQ